MSTVHPHVSVPQVVPSRRDTHPNKTQISILAAQLVNLNRKFYLVCSQSGLPRLFDIHHPDIHHLRHSSPQTFITPYLFSDIHHLRHSSPQTFITSDIHHLRRSSPQTFITPYLKSDIHHPGHSSPQTFITSDVHHLRHSSPPY